MGNIGKKAPTSLSKLSKKISFPALGLILVSLVMLVVVVVALLCKDVDLLVGGIFLFMVFAISGVALQLFQLKKYKTLNAKAVISLIGDYEKECLTETDPKDFFVSLSALLSFCEESAENANPTNASALIIGKDLYSALSCAYAKKNYVSYYVQCYINRVTQAIENLIGTQDEVKFSNYEAWCTYLLEQFDFYKRYVTPENKNLLLSQLLKITDIYKQQNQIDYIDTLSGPQFEQYTAKILIQNGYSNVKVLGGSGDQGVDIIAEKDGLRYAIQCKCYASNLGNTPVQEVHAGKGYYNCHVAAVLTNRYFTTGAKELAEKCGVLLWDRAFLAEMMLNTFESKISV